MIFIFRIIYIFLESSNYFFRYFFGKMAEVWFFFCNFARNFQTY